MQVAEGPVIEVDVPWIDVAVEVMSSSASKINVWPAERYNKWDDCSLDSEQVGNKHNQFKVQIDISDVRLADDVKIYTSLLRNTRLSPY